MTGYATIKKIREFEERAARLGFEIQQPTEYNTPYSAASSFKTVWIDEVDRHSPWNQRYDWCLANLGPGLESPPRWEPIGIGNAKFRFRDPKDEMWFRLRWG